MTNHELRIWLKGFFELVPEGGLNRKRAFIIRNHLNLVMAVERVFDERNQEIDTALSAILADESTPPQAYVALYHSIKRAVYRLSENIEAA